MHDIEAELKERKLGVNSLHSVDENSYSPCQEVTDPAGTGSIFIAFIYVLFNSKPTAHDSPGFNTLDSDGNGSTWLCAAGLAERSGA